MRGMSLYLGIDGITLSRKESQKAKELIDSGKAYAETSGIHDATRIYNRRLNYMILEQISGRYADLRLIRAKRRLVFPEEMKEKALPYAADEHRFSI